MSTHRYTDRDRVPRVTDEDLLDRIRQVEGPSFCAEDLVDANSSRRTTVEDAYVRWRALAVACGGRRTRVQLACPYVQGYYEFPRADAARDFSRRVHDACGRRFHTQIAGRHAAVDWDSECDL